MTTTTEQILTLALSLLPCVSTLDCDGLQAGGYWQAMPVAIRAELPGDDGSQTFLDYRAQNRLNLRWFASDSFNVTWEMRIRAFAGDLVRNVPGYADAINDDSGYFNLSTLLVDEDDWLLHYNTDRIFAEWSHGEWNLRAGRQRINWGINTVTNPNDLFNIYSIYEFDYPERPGTDALRLQRYTGHSSRWELALSPGDNSADTVAAGLYAFNTNGYDIQLIGGYYREKIALGGGWAGNMEQAGFKGEVMAFADTQGERDAHLVAAVSVDYMFDNSVFLIVEGLYNQRGGRDDFVLLGQALSADNPSLSRWQLTSQASYPVNPLLNTSMAAIWYPDEGAVFLSPSLTFSVTRNLDFQLLAQFFAGRSDSDLSNAGQLIAASLKYSY